MLLFTCSERLVKSTADAMVYRGLRAAGYNYVVLDDCWMDLKRDSNGELQADRQRFPSGIRSLIQYVNMYL
jgi:alpha-galactosidase